MTTKPMTDLHREVQRALQGRSLPVAVLARKLAITTRLAQALLDDLLEWGAVQTAAQPRKAKR